MTKEHSLLICEIGPIFDFVRHSRKTKDYWSASFLFSYIMAEVIKALQKEADANIFRPNVKNELLVTGKGKASAGSIPDQVFAIIPTSKKKDIGGIIENAKSQAIESLIPKIKAVVGDCAIVSQEVIDYINIFYIFHDLSDASLSHSENLEGERKIKARGMVRVFKPLTGESIPKWKKCNLCGDRESVYQKTIGEDSDGFFKEERICSVCMFKRFLPDALKKLDTLKDIVVEPAFDSTTDIAAVPFFQHVKQLQEHFGDSSDEIKTLQTLYCQCAEEYKDAALVALKKKCVGFDQDFGRCVYRSEDQPSASLKKLRKAFEETEEKMKQGNGDYVPLAWLKRPFYAIVYMDGDNMGNAIKDNKDRFSDYVGAVSRILSDFALNHVSSIINKYKGQLIFAGGDDVNFMIHPEHLLDCVQELTSCYNTLFANDSLTRDKASILTLSAGAIVCYHKYPLSEAILKAYNVMTCRAKKLKNALAIQLIKGHTETLTFALPNTALKDIVTLKEKFQNELISRTTPHRIAAERGLLAMLHASDEQAIRRYIGKLLAGTRNADTDKEQKMKIVKENVDLLMKFVDSGTLGDQGVDTLIDTLLYTRFLTGE